MTTASAMKFAKLELRKFELVCQRQGASSMFAIYCLDVNKLFITLHVISTMSYYANKNRFPRPTGSENMFSFLCRYLVGWEMTWFTLWLWTRTFFPRYVIPCEVKGEGSAGTLRCPNYTSWCDNYAAGTIKRPCDDTRTHGTKTLLKANQRKCRVIGQAAMALCDWSAAPQRKERDAFVNCSRN